MKRFKRNAIRLLFLLIVPLSLIVVASRARSAAEFPPPCKDEAAAQSSMRNDEKAALPALGVMSRR